MACAGNLAQGVVDVHAERLSALVAIEQRRKHMERQCGGNEERTLTERRENHIAKLASRRTALGQLCVVLCTSGLMAGGDATIDPIGRVENLASLRNLRRAENVGNGEKHWCVQ